MKYLIFALSLVCGPAFARSVYWNPVNSVGTDHEALIQFAAESWAERTGMAVTYAGQTSAVECVPNAITFRTAVVAEWNLAAAAAGFDPSPAGPHGWTFTCPHGGGYTLLLSPHHPVSRITILHELGHGLRGFGHLSFTSGALMLSSPPVSALVTAADVDYVLGSPDWPTPNAPSYCHNELAPDNDLMIPEIVINGSRMRVLLEYAGIVDGYHTWDVSYSVATTSKGCGNNTANSGTFTLTDVRGLNISYSSVTLQSYGGRIRLTGYTL